MILKLKAASDVIGRVRPTCVARARALGSVALLISTLSSPALAIDWRDVSGELEWTSPSLQGAAGIGAFSESWIDQAQADPSLLARRRSDFELEYAGASAVVSREAVNTVVDTVQSLTSESNSSSGSTPAQNTVKALNKVRDVFGKSMTVQLQTSLLAARYARVGLVPFASGVMDASIDNAAWPRLESFGGGYAGVLLSYSQVINKDFDLGVALRPGMGGFREFQVDLSVLGDFLNTSTTNNSSSKNPLEDLLTFPTAVYCPLDLAVGWWMDKSTRFSVVSKNTFDATPLKTLTGSPSSLQSRLNLGVVREIEIPNRKIQQLKVASELQDLAGLRGGWNEFLMRWQWAARYTARLPFREQTSFGLNVGMHSGYPVASVYLDFIVAKFEAALSARENGAYPGQRPNRLQSIKLLSQIQF